MNDEIWVLGATGRTGRAVAARLHAAGRPVVLVGRDRERLDGVAAGLDGAPRVVAGSLDAVLAALPREAPAVVVNTVGPFTATAARVARACPPGTHYVDVTNEFGSASAILDLHREAADTDRTFVTGAGFGVLATEGVLLRVCEGEPTPSRVRVDAVPSVATEPGVIGTALASSILGDAGSGGSRVEHGRLIGSPLGAEPTKLTTPDGDAVVTGSAPTAELLAAWRASGADSVVAASSVVPTGRAARLLMTVACTVLRVPAVSRFAVGRLARVSMKAQDRPRPHSWGHARVEWSSGATREGWFRTGDGMDFTVAAATEVALRLARGEGTPGAYTPGSLFGPDVALAAGGTFLVDESERR
jgi:short subunit dehydrogenase-like uncharacterized protein